MLKHFTEMQCGGAGTSNIMNRGQTKRLYRLLAGIGIITFLTFGFRTVDDLWDDSLGEAITERFESKQRDDKILTDRKYSRILAEEGVLAARTFRQSPHPNNDLYRAWQLMSFYRDWSGALTFGSMILFSALVYRIVWFLGDRSFQYVRDGGNTAPKNVNKVTDGCAQPQSNDDVSHTIFDETN